MPFEAASVSHSMSCGVDVEGRRHAVDERCCENEVEDEFGSHPYCEALHHALETKIMRKWMWMPEMLDYFWRYGVQRDGFDFLGGSGFLYSYKYVQPIADNSPGLRFLTSFSVQPIGI